MKKLFFALLLTATAAMAFAQNQVFYGSKTARLRVPVLTTNRDYLFPSYDLQTKNYDDTITVTCYEQETEAHIDSISGTTLVNLSPNSRMTAGGKVYLHLETTGAPQTVYVKQSSTVVDTLTVGDYNTNRTYVYDGTKYVKLDASAFPNYLYAVTQSSSITTGVTCNADAGVITTVSSTIAADDSSASFTLTNSFIKSTSVLQLTCGTAGNGAPYAQVTSQTAGSAVIKLYNLHRTAALNNTVKIHFLVLNR